MRAQYKEIIGIVILAVFFIVGAILSQRFSGEISRYLDFGIWGMAVYVAAGTLSTVIAPVNTVPLIPIAAALWGPFATALLSILAWWLGSLIAFFIARRYGRPLAARFVNMERVGEYEKILPERYVFWNIAFLRMAVPVDILSYAIGLFTSVGFTTYALATLIGVIPFAFVFAYAAQAPLPLQIGAMVLAAGALYTGYRRVKRLGKSK
ncbi:VTT domain-containing protein [Candidatus Parcubacteria bacterium]|nr:VTT domain-containing protein [Candidatus Parcubacteria bacterium]